MTAPHRVALVRRPSPLLADGLVTHVDRVPVDAALAQRQWVGYVAALAASGWRTVEVSPAPELPDSVFVEDTVVMFGPVAVRTRPGAPEREAEPDGAVNTLAELGYQVRTLAAGHLDGGDVLKVGRTVYVGRGSRTDPVGLAALRELLQPWGFQVITVPVTKALHLKSAVTALPDGTIIGYPPLIDDPAFFPHFRSMPEEAGAAVVDLGGGRLLLSAAAPESAAVLADLGYTPVPVGISEFEKMEGCVTCLSVRLRVGPESEVTDRERS